MYKNKNIKNGLNENFYLRLKVLRFAVLIMLYIHTKIAIKSKAINLNIDGFRYINYIFNKKKRDRFYLRIYRYIIYIDRDNIVLRLFNYCNFMCLYKICVASFVLLIKIIYTK